ncbi:import inner membrane translocase subunit tim-21, mitochondrial [Sordaria brevicollis]|uniref:Mitochondrial import inner membrane translocase subunit Tim21 n=1 Tax=Sordaria brevicollis TaxID=83679 RepID=A0AAE0UC78_SORBR|nr:import inner membrane translocase subunit tim-21, mitochondrial [Sordaria brevicollis]
MMKMLTTSAAGVRLLMGRSPAAAGIRQATTITRARAPMTATSAIIVSSRRQYATAQQETSSSKRRSVTPFNDDGHVPWTQLSAGEKAGRAVQQTFNFGLVILGVVMTGGIAYLLFTDVLSPESKTAYFNRAVDRIRADPRIVALLSPGDPKKIAAHGEETGNKWRRARPLAATVEKDSKGVEHLKMHFHVEGPRGSGVVGLHLTKQPGAWEHEYQTFYVDIRGHKRIYLENKEAERTAAKKGGKGEFKFLGVKWN